MLSRVLAIKWRPNSFSGLVGQEHITKTLANALNSNRLHHAYLFCGTRGIGKTTIARILAKSLSCEKGIVANACNECSACKSIDEGNYADLVEVDAASRTKVESTRELLDDMQFAPTKGRYKIYLIDEVHMLSNHSFNALLKSLEEPPPHIIFLFATTEPQKLPVTVLSRCLKFTLKALDQEIISAKLREILPQEKVDFDEESLKLISYYAAGSMRDGLSLTDQAIAYCDSNLEGKLVAEMLGVTGIVESSELLEYIATSNLTKITSVLHDMERAGANFVELWDRMMLAIHELTLVSLNFQDEASPELISLATKFSKEEFQLFYQIALNTKRELQWAPSMRSASEMAFIRMLIMQPLISAVSNDERGVSIPARQPSLTGKQDIDSSSNATKLPAEENAPAAESPAEENSTTAAPTVVAESPAEENSSTAAPAVVAELPAEENAPVATELPAEENAPVEAPELPAEENSSTAAPVEAPELPAEENAPVATELPAEENAPVATESPAEEKPAIVAESPTPETPLVVETPIDDPALSTEEELAETPLDYVKSSVKTPVEESSSAPTSSQDRLQENPNSANNDYTQANTWAELVDGLELTGMVESLIRDTRLTEIHGGIWILHCMSNVRSMFTDEIISSIENAVFDKINQSVQIEVEVGGVTETPAMLIDVRRKEMVEQIKQAPIVNTMINKFGGEIVEKSVRPIEPKN